MVGLEADPRRRGGHPHRLVRPQPARAAPRRRAARRPPRSTAGRGTSRSTPSRPRRAQPPSGSGRTRTGRWAGAAPRRRRTSAPAPAARPARPGRPRPSAASASSGPGPTSESSAQLGGGVARLDPGEEAHLLQERPAAARPSPGSVSSQVVVAVLGDHARDARRARAGRAPAVSVPCPAAQVGQVLGGEGVQPAEPLRPGHRDHAPVRPVDQADLGGERALLAHRVAVVGGDAGVAATCGSSAADLRPSMVIDATSAPHARAQRRRARRARCPPRNPCCARQLVGERLAAPAVDLLDRAADPADQVDVLVLADGVVGRRAVRQVRVGDQAELLEQLQRAVDGGDVDPGGRPRAPRRAPAPGVACPSS